MFLPGRRLVFASGVGGRSSFSSSSRSSSIVGGWSGSGSSGSHGGNLRIRLENSPQLCFGQSQRGIRRTNEDRFLRSLVALDPSKDDDALIAAVFDGHGGSEASHYCSENFNQLFHDAYTSLLTHDDFKAPDLARRRRQQMLLERAMLATFKSVDEAFMAKFPDAELAGSTASVAVIQPIETPDGHEQVPSILTIGHVGDTRILLCDVVVGKAQQLTVDHKPWERSERKRIQSKGGYVSTDSFGQQAIMGMLAVTRSIGVSKLKRAKDSVVISDPFIHSRVVDSNDAFLVFVSDGVTSVMSNQEIVDIVKHCSDPQSATEAILEIAEYYSTSDNSTALVMRLEGWPLHRPPPVTKDYTQNLRRYKLKHSTYGSRSSGMSASLYEKHDDDEEAVAEEDVDDNRIRVDRFIIDLFDVIGKDIGGSDMFADETGGLSYSSTASKYEFRDMGGFLKIGRITPQEMRDGIQALNVIFKASSNKVSMDNVVDTIFGAVGTSSDTESLEPSLSKSVEGPHSTTAPPHLREIVQSNTSIFHNLRIRESLSAADIARAMRSMNYRIYSSGTNPKK